MRSLQSQWLFFVFFILSSFESQCVQGKCLNDQRALLLQLNSSLVYDSSAFPSYSKRSSWSLHTDCCSWDGITCDGVGRVISLDLSFEYLSGGLNNSSSLFDLYYLERLDLANNNFSSPIPYGWDRLFNLEELSLSDCSLSGPLDSSLSQLQSLKVLRLNGNNFSTVVSDFFGDFPNIISLELRDCELYGKFPDRIFYLKTLQFLDLSYNKRLEGSLPEFPTTGLLQELVLSGTSYTGELPYSIGNLKHLSRLELKYCGFDGPIPDSISNLKQLQYLHLSSNNFTGTISSMGWPESLIMIDLSDNHLAGPISSEWWTGLQNLIYLNMENNSLSGIIPPVLFTLPSLEELYLSTNEFTGLGEFGASSPMFTLDLSGNKLQGCIPMSIFKLSEMEYLILSSNNFSCTLSLEIFFHKFKNLNFLSLSNNRLSITTASDNSALFPQVHFLSLSSCNLTKFPIFLKNQSELIDLDLSSNNIHGKIPNWIPKIGNGSLHSFNLSYNFLEDPDRPFPIDSFKSMTVLDVHSNKLQGKNPILPSSSADILDYSLNNFTSMIPSISDARFISFSSNQISGNIPASICEARSLYVLDLSHNNLSGPIPQCLGSMENLVVLNLRGNNLQGFIPEAFPRNCSMKTLNLNQNRFEGQLAKSLSNCTMLEVLDVGNNRLTGTFPSWLGNMKQLHVLVLRSNRFFGPWGNQENECNFPSLQILDISYNNFSGILSDKCFLSWKAMMIKEEEAEWNHRDQVVEFNYSSFYSTMYYQQTVTVTSKGIDYELVKIQTIFTSIDLSNNDFEGEIPKSIGNLTSLCVLNFSNNALTGPIPSTFGNLTHLESMDLSRNKLTGEIPFQLASLSFLSTLKLSFNKLVGKIPSGNQMQTYPSSSFEGNDGLCGHPLSKECSSGSDSPENSSTSGDDEHDGFDWILFVVTFLGFVMGASIVIGPQYFWKRGREWANERINRILNIT